MRYWRIANSDGKVWLMPRQNVRVALALYQPSGWRGKVLKRLLPWMSVLPEAFALFPVIDWTVNDAIRDVVEQIFPDKKLEWAVFEGTPCVHQKQVIQVYCGQEILAYCKISAKSEIKELFTQEADLLQELSEKEVGSIPRCLYCGSIEEGRGMLVLSTEKTIRSKTPHGWSGLLQSFVDDLQSKTSHLKRFDDSDLAKAIVLLRARTGVLPACMERNGLERALEYVESQCHGKILECAVMHGDFTPWNMCEDGERLFVFDWEYAYRDCPVGLDRYHFCTQTAFFEHHWSAQDLMRYAETPDGAWMDVYHLICYLLLALYRFVGREPDDRQMSDTPLLAYWNQLLILCLNKK